MAIVMLSASSVAWAWLTVVILVASVIGLACQRPIARRVTAAVAVAILTSVSVAAAVGCCQSCDPWWLEWFWICVPR